MTLANHQPGTVQPPTAPAPAARSSADTTSRDELARMPAATLLATLLAEGVAVPPNLTRGELVAAAIAQRLAQQRHVRGDGVLELLSEGFGFLRSPWCDYEASPHDPFVSPSQVRGLNLKTGQRLTGPLRAPQGNERFFALVHIDSVDGGDPADAPARVSFAARTPIAGTQPLGLAGAEPRWTLLRHLAPWSRGQRVLITAPPSWPRLAFLASLAQSLAAADHRLLVSVCALDARPEELAALRTIVGSVASNNGPSPNITASTITVTGATFDQAPARQIALVEMVLARAQRDVEAGRDVVLLFDSLSALTRAVQRESPPSGRWLCAGLDAPAVLPGKRLFAAARACAEGGSLTVLATIVIEPGSVPDTTLLTEFRHRANGEVGIDPALAADDPAAALPFDVAATHTRPEDDTRSPAERAAAATLRRELMALPPAARSSHLDVSRRR
jgi:transcription termination factor Rho